MERPRSENDIGSAICALGNPTQIGILVKDARKTAKILNLLTGIGPWRFEDWPPENRPEFESYSDGKPTSWRATLAFSICDSLEIELIETYEGECGYSDFVNRRGEGMHHLQFRVDDVDVIADRFVKQGIKIKMGATGRRPGTKWVLLDTEEMIGFDIELTSK
jgi:methylmalonyl-CoA/ethylmalonyl-CoA epimerase